MPAAGGRAPLSLSDQRLCCLSRPSRPHASATPLRVLHAYSRRGAAPGRSSARSDRRRGSRRADSAPPSSRRRRGLTLAGSAPDLLYVRPARDHLPLRPARSRRAAAAARHARRRGAVRQSANNGVLHATGVGGSPSLHWLPRLGYSPLEKGSTRPCPPTRARADTHSTALDTVLCCSGCTLLRRTRAPLGATLHDTVLVRSLRSRQTGSRSSSSGSGQSCGPACTPSCGSWCSGSSCTSTRWGRAGMPPPRPPSGLIARGCWRKPDNNGHLVAL